MDYIPRALEPIVRRYSQYFKVVVVTGPRQVGKTTMLKHLMGQDEAQGISRAYVSLDNTSLAMLAREDPELFLQRYRPPILIDEIQRAPQLLPYIKALADDSHETGAWWLTGSQPMHLMKEVSESLAGRAGVIEMLGLSNAELAEAPTVPFVPDRELLVERAAAMPPFGVDEAYRRMTAGSLPGIRALPEDMRGAGYESYVETYLMRDIRDLASVSDEMRFRRFMSACAALTSKPVVYAELARVADIDEKTAKSWLSLLVSSYLVKVVQPYSNNLLKRLNKQPIMHFIDTGLAAHLSGWHSAEALELGAVSGQMFETYVFGEVYKSFSNCGMRPPLSFFRNNDKKEIDLLVDLDGCLHPIEVKKTASPNSRDAKNFGVLAPVEGDGIPPELQAFKREVGFGAVVCLASDARPVSEQVWAVPVWSI